ncbi:hypothetical protein IBA8401_43200 [Pseudomonas syringae]|uniref:hypothetical protein n=1 Tax=Pseudomonas viridiflava TaxID=33069 RepID=UPI000F010855|nr:hypothetical protein [Pseudomonas viridiflava]
MLEHGHPWVAIFMPTDQGTPQRYTWHLANSKHPEANVSNHKIYLLLILMSVGTLAVAAMCIYFGLYKVNKSDPEKERRALAIYHHVYRDVGHNAGDISHILTDHYSGHFKRFAYSLATCALCFSIAIYIVW